MFYELKLEKFQGPLEKLLELIEGRKLEINEISLAQVTDDFLVYLGKLAKAAKADRDAEEFMRLVADFVVVASRLVYLKSKSLLPALAEEEEEAGLKELEHRLRLYRELRPALKHLARLWQAREEARSRPYFLEASGAVTSAGLFYPGVNLSLEALHGALGKLFSSFEKFVRETEEIREKIISLEEKMQQVLSRIREMGETTFARLGEAQSRAELIVTFIALLHLARERIIFLEQQGPLSDIIVKYGKSGG